MLYLLLGIIIGLNLTTLYIVSTPRGEIRTRDPVQKITRRFRKKGALINPPNEELDGWIEKIEK